MRNMLTRPYAHAPQHSVRALHVSGGGGGAQLQHNLGSSLVHNFCESHARISPSHEASLRRSRRPCRRSELHDDTGGRVCNPKRNTHARGFTHRSSNADRRCPCVISDLRTGPDGACGSRGAAAVVRGTRGTSAPGGAVGGLSPFLKPPFEPYWIVGNLFEATPERAAKRGSLSSSSSSFVASLEVSLLTMQSRNGLAEVSFLLVLVAVGVAGFVSPLASNQQLTPLQEHHHDHAHCRLSGLSASSSARQPVALCRTSSRIVHVRPLSVKRNGDDSQVHVTTFGTQNKWVVTSIIAACNTGAPREHSISFYLEQPPETQTERNKRLYWTGRSGPVACAVWQQQQSL